MVWRWKKLPSQRYSSKSHWQSWYVCKWYNHWKARITLLCSHPGWKNLYCYFQVWWIFSWNQFHEKFRGNDFTENHTDFQKVLVNFSVKSIPWKISQKFRENDFTENLAEFQKVLVKSYKVWQLLEPQLPGCLLYQMMKILSPKMDLLLLEVFSITLQK